MSELERTEKATPRKRQKERQKGNVAKSQEIVAALGLLVAVVTLAVSSKSSAAAAFENMRSAFANGFILQANEFSFASEGAKLISFVLQKLAGFFLLIVLASVVGNVLQTGFLILPKKTLPDFKRVNPVVNLKRFFSATSFMQALGGLARTILFASLVAVAIKRDAQTIVALPYAEPIDIVLFSSSFLTRVAYQFCALAIILAVVDYGIRRWKYEQDIRMTRHELSDEIKEESGSPQTRGRRQEARRTLMNSIDAISGTAPTFPVSPFQPKQDRKTSEYNKGTRK